VRSRSYLLLFCLLAAKGLAQQGPQPGDIYREYAVNLRSGDNWRVTDPQASHPGAAEFLPNPVPPIQIDDLEKAVKAEVLLDIWGGHPGTSGKKFRFNGNSWMDIPRVPTLVLSSQCYMKQYNVILDLPLEYLHEGENSFEGTSGGQVCGNFNWGQWGWYVMMVRIYYQPDKTHTTGQIVYPLSGDTIIDDPIVKIATADTGSVSSIQVLGHYHGYDEDGDGNYTDWHRAYHSEEISGHIGTLEEAPFDLTWNTRYIPDQEAGAVSFLARVRDTSGIWFVSDVVDSVTLQRPDSLKVLMHKAYDVPERFWVRNGNTRHCYVNVNNPGEAMEAYLYHRTWNAGDGEAAGGSIEKPLRVNGHGYKCYGKDHFYALSGVQLATGNLLAGANKIAYTSNTVHHGIEVLWPGPALVVRYVTGGDTLSSPEFSPPDGTSFQGALMPVIYYETDGRKIYYSTDGSDPNPSDERYRGQVIRVDRDMTLKARAFKRDAYESEVVTASYTLDLTSLHPFPEKEVLHYPNPASDKLYLELPPELENGKFSIYDVEGRVVLKGSASTREIHIDPLNDGIYFLKYEASRQIYAAKFVVQR
jgi:hypothetical protein